MPHRSKPGGSRALKAIVNQKVVPQVGDDGYQGGGIDQAEPYPVGHDHPGPGVGGCHHVVADLVGQDGNGVVFQSVSHDPGEVDMDLDPSAVEPGKGPDGRSGRRGVKDRRREARSRPPGRERRRPGREPRLDEKFSRRLLSRRRLRLGRQIRGIRRGHWATRTTSSR